MPPEAVGGSKKGEQDSWWPRGRGAEYSASPGVEVNGVKQDIWWQRGGTRLTKMAQSCGQRKKTNRHGVLRITGGRAETEWGNMTPAGREVEHPSCG